MRSLGNTSLPSAALDRFLLFSRDNSIFLEVIGIVGDRAYEFTVAGGAARQFCNLIDDGATFREQGVEDTRIAAVYHYRWAEV